MKIKLIIILLFISVLFIAGCVNINSSITSEGIIENTTINSYETINFTLNINQSTSLEKDKQNQYIIKFVPDGKLSIFKEKNEITNDIVNIKDGQYFFNYSIKKLGYVSKQEVGKINIYIFNEDGQLKSQTSTRYILIEP